jgi:hypothetical protein
LKVSRVGRVPRTLPPTLLATGWVFMASAMVGAAHAQEVASPELRGEVSLGDGTPVPGATVVLHRVDAIEAGELDSIQASATGAFRFDLPTVPDPGGRGEVYFASVRHQGVLYFGPPVSAAIQLDSTYLIQVYDTAVAPVRGAPLPTSVRYILAERQDDAWQVTDLIQLDVQGDRTWVAADSGISWRYPLPQGLRDLQVGGGDVPPATVQLREGVLEVTAPLPPGARQMVIRYALDSLTVDIPLPGGVGEMDFLVRDPGPRVEVLGLVPAESVEMEPGVRYRRFAGVAVPDTVLRVTELPPEFRLPLRWLAVLLALLLTGVGLYAVRRPTGAHPSRPGRAEPAPLSRDDLVREVARLDLTLEGMPDGPERRRLEGRRETLLSEIIRRP